MRCAASAILLLVLGDVRCEHPVRGDSRPVDLDAVERAYREAARRVAMRMELAALDDPLTGPFDSGLPACRCRGQRVEPVDPLPRELVGRTLHFGPRAREGSIHVVTRAPSLRSAIGSIPAAPELTGRFKVHCAPSTVRVTSETTVTIDEEP